VVGSLSRLFAGAGSGRAGVEQPRKRRQCGHDGL
jgi:hypothetical protein